MSLVAGAVVAVDFVEAVQRNLVLEPTVTIQIHICQYSCFIQYCVRDVSMSHGRLA